MIKGEGSILRQRSVMRRNEYTERDKTNIHIEMTVNCNHLQRFEGKGLFSKPKIKERKIKTHDMMIHTYIR